MLDVFVANGILEASQRELFPVREEHLRKMASEIGAVIYALTPDRESELWSIAQLVLNASFTEAGSLRFFSEDSEFPDGTPRAIGLRIVEPYLANNPGATVSSLITVHREEIYEGSNYNP